MSYDDDDDDDCMLAVLRDKAVKDVFNSLSASLHSRPDLV